MKLAARATLLLALFPFSSVVFLTGCDRPWDRRGEIPVVKRILDCSVSIEDLEGNPCGSGVAVNSPDGMFVWTAGHVVTDEKGAVMREVVVSFMWKDLKLRSFTADVLWSEHDPKNEDQVDLALLHLKDPGHFLEKIGFPVHFSPLGFSIDETSVGDEVIHVGCMGAPGRSPFDPLPEPYYNAVSYGHISRKDTGGRTLPGKLDMATLTAFYGSSGGGIYRASDGKCLGLLDGFALPGGMMHFVPARAIFEMAKKHGNTAQFFGSPLNAQ